MYPCSARPGGTRLGRRAALLLVLCLAAGCADSKLVRRTCPQPTDPTAAAQRPAPVAAYRVACPDALEVAFADHPHLDAVAVIDVDGRLPLAALHNPLVDGLTIPQIQTELAARAGCAPERVSVALAAARSAKVVVYGPVGGRGRAVPYQGPEPVIDFLKRVGGLPPGSKLNQVYVIRPNVAAGTQPEVFRVNVAAVLTYDDHRTNVLLQPDDQIYVGETRRSSLTRMMPDWMGDAYRRVAGMLPEEWWPRGPVVRGAK